jgi:hypothetical protein
MTPNLATELHAAAARERRESLTGDGWQELTFASRLWCSELASTEGANRSRILLRAGWMVLKSGPLVLGGSDAESRSAPAEQIAAEFSWKQHGGAEIRTAGARRV